MSFKRPSIEQIITIVKNNKIYQENLENHFITDTDFDKYDKIYELGEDFYRFINFRELNLWFKDLYFSKGGNDFIFDKKKVKFNNNDFIKLKNNIKIENIKSEENKLDFQLFLQKYENEIKNNKNVTLFYECVIDFNNIIQY